MIDFLKKYSLPVGLKRSVKKMSGRRQSTSYAQAKSVLLFFTSEGNQKIALVKGLQNKLEKEGKSVSCMYLLMKDEDKPDVHMDDGMERLVPEDFTLFGDIEKPEVKNLLDQEFDYMIHVDKDSNIYSELVMSKSKSKCRVGRYYEDHVNQYYMMVKVSDD
jgi:hypothetical protein